MTFVSTCAGVAYGFFVAVYSNGIQKLPYLRRPWEHLLSMGFFGYIGHCCPSWKKSLLDEVNRTRAQQKLPPIDKPEPYNYAFHRQNSSS
mmetsp:Transcript_15108/g.19995  ORF Transcript_15108/g.19995 Transcript_15108/m.19995 type:complete len:90 (+) Transcript_15108:85-354(+)